MGLQLGLYVAVTSFLFPLSMAITIFASLVMGVVLSKTVLSKPIASSWARSQFSIMMACVSRRLYSKWCTLLTGLDGMKLPSVPPHEDLGFIGSVGGADYAGHQDRCVIFLVTMFV